MSAIALHKNHDDLRESGVENALLALINRNEVMAIATTDGAHTPCICNAFFAHNGTFNFIILTDPSTQHGKNWGDNAAFSCTIANTTQQWKNPKQGIQLAGEAVRLPAHKSAQAFALYAKRFPDLLKALPTVEAVNKLHSRFYELKATSFKLFDEPTFGKGVWISGDITS